MLEADHTVSDVCDDDAIEQILHSGEGAREHKTPFFPCGPTMATYATVLKANIDKYTLIWFTNVHDSMRK